MPSADKTNTGRLIIGKTIDLGKKIDRRPPKYRAIPTVVDGIRFDSRRESERYSILRLLQRSGEIRNLQLQVKFPMEVNGQHICTYVADFTYTDTATEAYTVEDVKGMATPVYRLKKKLVKAIYGIEILEV